MNAAQAALQMALRVADLTQADLARQSGLSAKHVNQVFTGKVPLSVDVALRIEAVLPVSAEGLMVAQVRQQVRDARALA